MFFELCAGGYNGSTYTLTFDRADNGLKGVYYQAVAKQKFDVVSNVRNSHLSGDCITRTLAWRV